MSIKAVRARDLEPGNVLVLPFDKLATVTSVKRGTRFMNLTLAEYPKTRIELDNEVVILNDEGGDDDELVNRGNRPVTVTRTIGGLDSLRAHVRELADTHQAMIQHARTRLDAAQRRGMVAGLEMALRAIEDTVIE